MNKRIFGILICVLLLFAAAALTACTNEAEALQERIVALEDENEELQSTVTSLRADLDRAQSDLSRTRNELQDAQSALAAAEEDDAQDSSQGPLAITYGGEPNTDMSWPFNYGELDLGLRINANELGDAVDIVWRSTDEDIFTVEQSGDGMSATVTPETVGSAQLVVTVGDQETRSWVRIT